MRSRGLTLVEMVVVVAIVLILIGLGMNYYTNMGKRALRNDAVAMSRELVVATKSYYLDNRNKYPPAGAITPLANYINVTPIAKGHFSAISLSEVGSGVGVMGVVKDIADEYCILWVVREGAGAFDLSKNPLCRWAGASGGSCNGAVTASYHHDWRACDVGM